MQTVLILGLMGGIFALIGFLIYGIEGMVWSLIFAGLFMLFAPRLTPSMVLRMYRATYIDPRQGGRLYSILEELSARAHLAVVPRLYYVPSRLMNAFTVGNREGAAIAVTDGLVRNLSLEELAGVLAHEISHIEHNDLWIMNLADSLSRFTRLFSTFGMLLLFIYLPVFFMVGNPLPFLVVGVLFFAPTMSALLQMALSRTREYDADLNAARLTGDPSGLARALQKIDSYTFRFLDIFYVPGKKMPGPSMLRTHPHTEKRIERLMDLGSRFSRKKDYAGGMGSTHSVPDIFTHAGP